MVKNEVMIESAKNLPLKSADMSKPLQQLFDECLNLISKTSFEN